MNDEQDALEAALGDDCVSIYGSLEHDEKIRRFHRWERGEVRVLVSKPSIFGFGVNMQQCARVAFVGVTHSFEQFFQAVRRCHRFGQLREVHVHVVCSDLEAEVLASLRRKERDAGAMLESMVVAMRGLQGARVNGAAPDAANYVPPAIAPPTWLSRRAS